MKKFFSILLALAMVISCVAVVSFAETGAGVEVSGNSTGEQGYVMRFASGLGNAMAAAIEKANNNGGNGELVFNVYNTGDKEIGLKIYFQGGDNGWALISGATTVNKVVEAGYAVKFTVPFTVTDGKVYGQDMSKLTLRMDMQDPSSLTDDNGKLTDGAKFIIESPDLSADFLATLSTSGRTLKRVTEIPAFTTAPKVVVKPTVNGDVEKGTTEGWSVQNGGSVKAVAGGANNTGYAIEFTPSGAWATAAFKFGADIVNDADANVNGGGAGKYKITFWAKAAEGKGGKFNVMINSFFHKGASQVAALLGCDVKEACDTYVTGPSFTMTDEWQKFEVEMEVSEKYLDTLKQLYVGGHADNAYDLALRFDGSDTGGGAYKKEQFTYFVDEVTISKVVENNTNPGGEGDGGNDKTEETPAPTPTPAPVLTGVQYAFSNEYSGEFFITSSTSAGGVVTATDIKDGTITKSVTVKNNGKEDITIQLFLQATVTVDGNQRWEAVDGGESEKVTVEAGKTATLTFTCDVENGIVVVKDQDVAVEKLFFRFNVLGEGGEKVLPEGTSFTVYCANETEANYLLSGSMASKEGVTRTGVYDKVSGSVGSGDVLPVAFIALTVISSIALTVVVKKRKEIF